MKKMHDTDIQVNWRPPEWPSRRGDGWSPGRLCPRTCADTPPSTPRGQLTHLGVLDPDRAGRQRLRHYLALGSDDRDRLIDCAP